MLNETDYKNVLELVGRGDLGNALVYLADRLHGTKYYKETYLISARLERLNQGNRIGIIAESEKQLEINKISFSIIELTETILKPYQDLIVNEHKHIRFSELDERNLIEVTGGEFVMGSNQGPTRERPAHKVFVDTFLLYKYPITINQYLYFCKETEKDMPPPPKWGWYDNHPIVNISWNDAMDFCKWSGTRLPTEAEWEYAGKGGKFGLESTYSGGNVLNEVGWYHDNSSRKTHEVGRKKPNELGLYDMTGNVWEWCQDTFSEEFYYNSPLKNPVFLGKGTSDKIGRGGSWYSYSKNMHLSYRYKNLPTECREDLGFRICKDK